MIQDIEGRSINIGDEIVFSDNKGVNKGIVLKITDKTIKIDTFNIDDRTYDHDKKYFHTIRLLSNNGKYIYKIC